MSKAKPKPRSPARSEQKPCQIRAADPPTQQGSSWSLELPCSIKPTLSLYVPLKQIY